MLRPTTAPVLALTLALASASLSAQQASSISRERLDAVERFVERSRGRLGLPGVAVSVASGDSVLLAVGFGAATRDGGPITGQTPFHIGSVTKTMSAVLAARLAEQARLDLDAPVETYLADLTMRRPFVPRSITVRHLLQHRSGFSQWDGHDRRAQERGAFGHLKPARAPDVRSEYSSLNYIVLGRILESVSRQSYASHLQTGLFDPLGMKTAFVEGGGTPTAAPALGHQSYFGFQRARREPTPPTYLVPAGFAGASADDLGRFGGALVGGGTFGNVRYLEPATVAEILGPLDTIGRALGWGRSHAHGGLILEHAGNSRTTSARVRLVPQSGYAIAVLTNTNSGPFFSTTAQLTDGIHAILNGETAPTVWPKERMFKGVLLIGTALTLVQMAGRVREWDDAGRPTRLATTSRALTPLAWEAASATFILAGLPRIIGVPLHTMTEYFPDLGLALWISAGAGVAGGVFRAYARSAP